MEGQGSTATPLAVPSRPFLNGHSSTQKMDVTSSFPERDAFLSAISSRASGVRGRRPLTSLMIIASIAMITFLILQCLRTMRRVSGPSRDGKRALADGGGDMPQCSGSLPAALTTSQATELTARLRTFRETLQQLKKPSRGSNEIDQAALETTLVEAVAAISDGLAAEFEPSVPLPVQQELREELQIIVAVANSAIVFLTESWADMLNLRNSLLQSSLEEFQEEASGHSSRNPPNPSSPAVMTLLEVRGRLLVAKELCADLRRFTQFPFQEGVLDEHLAALEARIMEVENGARLIVGSFVDMWRSRLNAVREAVNEGAASQANLNETEEDAFNAVATIREVSGFDVDLY
ncbi:hypothetical protein Emag_004315 [Eimeria magna]